MFRLRLALFSLLRGSLGRSGETVLVGVPIRFSAFPFPFLVIVLVGT
jgi:hypothetical protein